MRRPPARVAAGTGTGSRSSSSSCRCRAGSARIAGVPNSVIDCRNATRNPASSAGRTSGNVTSSAVRHAGAPRIAEASSSSLGNDVEAVGDEREHVGERVERHHEHHAAGGEDVDQRRRLERLQPEQRVVPLVDEAGVRSAEQHPGERAEEGRRHERGEDQQRAAARLPGRSVRDTSQPIGAAKSRHSDAHRRGCPQRREQRLAGTTRSPTSCR